MSTPLGELRPIEGGEPIQLVEERILIGSHRYCNVVIRSSDVAPLHCQLYLRGTHWHVRDFTGTGDTRVNSLPARDERLDSGDLLWIGSTHKYELWFDADTLSSFYRVLPMSDASNLGRGNRWRISADLDAEHFIKSRKRAA